MNRKTCVRILLPVLALLFCAAAYLLGSGFVARTDVFVTDYDLSEDGRTLTLQVGVLSSVGYTRAVQTRQEGEVLYCTFSGAFGGINGSWGARNTFSISLPEDCARIAFARSGGDWQTVLQKDGEGRWGTPIH